MPENHTGRFNFKIEKPNYCSTTTPKSTKSLIGMVWSSHVSAKPMIQMEKLLQLVSIIYFHTRKISRITCPMNNCCYIVSMTSIMTNNCARVLLNKLGRNKPPWISVRSSSIQHPPNMISQALDKIAPVFLPLPSKRLPHYLNWLFNSSARPFHFFQDAGPSTLILLTVLVA